jgi:hypothetical protein
VKEIAQNSPITARSRTGYLILYANCPVVWCSKLQTEISHSATEAEYVALSQSLKEVTALMHLMGELKQANFKLNDSTLEMLLRYFHILKSKQMVNLNSKQMVN